MSISCLRAIYGCFFSKSEEKQSLLLGPVQTSQRSASTPILSRTAESDESSSERSVSAPVVMRSESFDAIYFLKRRIDEGKAKIPKTCDKEDLRQRVLARIYREGIDNEVDATAIFYAEVNAQYKQKKGVTRTAEEQNRSQWKKIESIFRATGNVLQRDLTVFCFLEAHIHFGTPPNQFQNHLKVVAQRHIPNVDRREKFEVAVDRILGSVRDKKPFALS